MKPFCLRAMIPHNFVENLLTFRYIDFICIHNLSMYRPRVMNLEIVAADRDRIGVPDPQILEPPLRLRGATAARRGGGRATSS